MNIEIKKSVKPVNYIDAINIMEERLEQIFNNKEKELIWTLEHEEIYTGGTSYSEIDIIDKSIKIIETNRGGKITCHGPGQLIFYFVLDLRNKKDIRKFINSIEKTIIETLKTFDIIYLTTKGGPARSTEFLSTYIFQKGILEFKASYASTMALMIVVIALILTILQVKGYNRR